MKRHLDTLVVLILYLPMLLWLAPNAQGPDGAELVMTAVQGGVNHPSGMPLQSWLDRLFVLLPLAPAMALSFLSWLASLIATIFLMKICARLNISQLPRWFAAALFAYYPVFTAMSIQPEKYALMVCLSTIFIYMVVIDKWWPAALTLGLAVAQHTALVILIPAGVIASWRKIPRLIIAAGIAAVVVVAAYVSLLLLRTSSPWPDWGHLQNLSDVWSHFVRSGFYIDPAEANAATNTGNKLSGLEIFLQSLWNLPILTLSVSLGLWPIYKSQRRIFYVLTASIIAGLAVIFMAQLRSEGQEITLGYIERYPCLILPFLAIFSAAGFERLLAQRALALVSTVLLGIYICNSISLNRQTNSDVVGIFREEVGAELPIDAIFISQSDFESFYGVPCPKGTCFPLKNLFGYPWYREQVAPTLAPPFLIIMQQQQPKSYLEFLTFAFRRGLTLATTSPQMLLDVPELAAGVEQVGLLWLFNINNHGLYSHRILESAKRLCTRLSAARNGIPAQGLYFVRDPLQKISLTLRSASDHLSQTGSPAGSAQVAAIADQIGPGKPLPRAEDCLRAPF